MAQELYLRKDTIDKNRGVFIDPNKQTFIGILGKRGSGKSFLGDTLLESYYNLGFTCLDLFSAPFYENYFWCLPRKGLNKDGQPFKKRYPITILAPESLKEDVDGKTKFNNDFSTRVPLIRFVKLPTPTVKPYSEQNDGILSILTDEILRCRSERRILTFNTTMFPSERSMYLTLEIIFRGILKVAHEHFHQLTKADLGRPLTLHEKSYHKMAFQLREIGMLFPSREKGDQSGYSKNTKKGFLEFVRLARHGNISGIFDYQNTNDAISSIRHQIDVWALKKWNEQLAGDQFKWVFPIIKHKREKIAEQYRFNKDGWTIADSMYPRLEDLSNKWFYALLDGYYPKLQRVPTLGIRHKEPVDNWEMITGIKIEHDSSLIDKEGSTGKAKVSTSDEKLLYQEMVALKAKKGTTWNDVRLQLAEKQQKGDISSNLDFSTISPLHMGSKFAKLKKKFESE